MGLHATFARPAIWLAMICIAAGLAGCTSGGGSAMSAAGDKQTVTLDPPAIQAANMSFADRYFAAMADQYDKARATAKNPQAAILAQRLKILAGTDALGNAVNPNPLAGLMDMAVMVTLAHEIAHDAWVRETFGPETTESLIAVLKLQEEDVWSVAGPYVTPEQVKELRTLAVQWRAEHPTQRYIVGARLADFNQQKRDQNNPADVIVGSALNLVKLDPFRGLDPAVKEIAESRVLAERLFFYLRHMPMLMSWQSDMLFDQMLAQPQMTQLFANTTAVAGSTTRFSEATSQFSEASTNVAESVEKFRLQLPDQQAKLVAELGAAITAQQGLMTQNLQVISDQSIDRLYQRGRSLVFVTVGSILLAFILYRQTGRSRTKSKVPT